MRVIGHAYGFTFDHAGEVESEAPNELVVRISAPYPRRLKLLPRIMGTTFPLPADAMMTCTFDYIGPRPDLGVGVESDIAHGMAYLRQVDDQIQIDVDDHTGAAPTPDGAPLAP
ncbi:MAG TPA: hypothetical protein VGA38_03480 [Candidatus Limnocylindria bacterium]